MRIEAYLLPPGSDDKRRALIADAIAESCKTGVPADFSGVLYLAPTAFILESGRRAMHEAISPHHACYIPPRVMTLGRLARLYQSGTGGRPIIRRTLIPAVISAASKEGIGVSCLRGEFISEMKRAFPAEPIEALRDRLYSEFEELGMPGEISERAMKAFDAFGEYEDALKTLGMADEYDSMGRLQDDPPRSDLLLIDGFYELEPIEEQLIRALIEKARRTLITVPISAADDDLSYCFINSMRGRFDIETAVVKTDIKQPATHPYHAAPSMEEEVQHIARHIKNSYISGRVRDLEDVFVVFPDLNAYREMAARIFGRYGIPFAMSRPRPLSMAAPYLDLLALLQSVVEDFPRLPFCRALSSPFLGNISKSLKADVADIALDASLVKGREAWLRAFGKKQSLKEAERIFNAIAPLNRADNKGSYTFFINALLDILKTLDYMPSDDGRAELEDILEQLKELDSIAEGGVGLSHFVDALRMSLAFAPALPIGEGVRMADIYELRGYEPGVLYIGGLRDGEMPKRQEMDLLLPDSVRRRLGLVDLERHMRLQEKIFSRAAASARYLHLSYPTMDGDKFYLPSPYISGGERRQERVFGILSEEEKMIRSGRGALSGKLREISNTGHLRDKALNVTEIDNFRRCPRKYFISDVLGLEPREIEDYELDPRVLGTVMHMVMQELIGSGLNDLPSFSRSASIALEKVLAVNDLDLYFREIVREAFMGLVPGVFDLEQKIWNEGYRFCEAELKMEGEPLAGVRLKGKADRIDLIDGTSGEGAEGVQIIDYKTGAQRLSSTGTLKRGQNLQLFLYAAMLAERGLRPLRVGIYSLGEVGVSWLPSKADIKAGVRMDDYMALALKYVEDTVRKMRGGDFGAEPLDDQACRNCHERPYCPYIKGTRAGQAKGSG